MLKIPKLAPYQGFIAKIYHPKPQHGYRSKRYVQFVKSEGKSDWYTTDMDHATIYKTKAAATKALERFRKDYLQEHPDGKSTLEKFELQVLDASKIYENGYRLKYGKNDTIQIDVKRYRLGKAPSSVKDVVEAERLDAVKYMRAQHKTIKRCKEEIRDQKAMIRDYKKEIVRLTKFEKYLNGVATKLRA
jgi:hypothetical protein